MDDRAFDRVGAVSAVAVATLSVLYAVAYLIIAPTAQRASDVDKFFRSYLAHPGGLRLASASLLLSGVFSGLAIVAFVGRLEVAGGRLLAWARIVGVTVGLVTAMHGMESLIALDKLAHRYATGDAVVRSAVVTAHAVPSSVDPRGLFTFGFAGLVALALGVVLHRQGARLGAVGIVLGVDMIVLFLATAFGLAPLILLTGGLASVVLGPLWWVGIAQILWRGRPRPVRPAVSPGPAT